ncbi:MAG: site-specific integrase [Planctomycetaceae bacterium]|nr:site-specific integrase [Planctomycetaceae bacterium]
MSKRHTPGGMTTFFQVIIRSSFDLARLLDAAETGPPASGLTGRDRAMLYMLAAYTGFRKGELGSLTRRSFRLDCEPCTVTIQAPYSKRRREGVQVMHPDLVANFKKWLEIKEVQPNDILFPISRKTCGTERDGAAFLTFDLGAARTFWIAEAETEEEEKRRIASDFLTYKNDEGKFADFHCISARFFLDSADCGTRSLRTSAGQRSRPRRHRRSHDTRTFR